MGDASARLPPVGFDKHLLIDGANVIHAWPDLRALVKRDRDAARSRLSQAVSAIHDTEEIRLTLVFDGRGDELVIEQPSRQATFTHIYTPAGATADDVIEQWVGRAREPGSIYVATNDRAERDTVAAAGATVISAEDLLAWVERARSRQGQQMNHLTKENRERWKKPKT